MQERTMSEGLTLQSANIIAEVSAAIDNASKELRRLSLEVSQSSPCFGADSLLIVYSLLTTLL